MPEVIDHLKALETVYYFYCGGPLAESLGEFEAVSGLKQGNRFELG
jgi:hypothetical protein